MGRGGGKRGGRKKRGRLPTDRGGPMGGVVVSFGYVLEDVAAQRWCCALIVHSFSSERTSGYD